MITLAKMGLIKGLTIKKATTRIAKNRITNKKVE